MYHMGCVISTNHLHMSDVYLWLIRRVEVKWGEQSPTPELCPALPR